MGLSWLQSIIPGASGGQMFSEPVTFGSKYISLKAPLTCILTVINLSAPFNLFLDYIFLQRVKKKKSAEPAQINIATNSQYSFNTPPVLYNT